MKFSPTFLCLSFLSGSFGVASSRGTQSQTRFCTGDSGSHIKILAVTWNEKIKVAESIAQVNYKVNLFLLCYKNEWQMYKVQIRLTRDRWIPWEKQCLGYVLCTNILWQSLQILVLTVADNLWWQSKEFLVYRHRYEVRIKENGNSEWQTWVPLTLKLEKSIKENQLSHFKFNLWILLYLSWFFTDLCSICDYANLWLIFASTESPISSMVNS